MAGGRNPASNRLTDWLMQILKWSGDVKGDHAAIQLVFDVKDEVAKYWNKLPPARRDELFRQSKKERKDLGQVVDETVRGTLVALNIPSRREVSELTRKVDELSRKIDSYRRSSSNRSARRRGPAAASA